MQRHRDNPGPLPCLAERVSIAIAAAIVAFGGSRCTSLDAEEAPDVTDGGRVPVYVDRVTVASIRPSLRRIGTVRATADWEVTAGVPGTIVSIAALGDVFAAGDVLVEVDTAELDARAAQIDAELDRSRVERDHACRTADTDEALVRSGATTPARADASGTRCLAASAAVDAVEARRREARATRDGAAWRAPTNGVVVRRLAEPGEYAAPGRPLLRVASEGREVVVRLTQRDLDGTAIVGASAIVGAPTARIATHVQDVSPSATGPGPSWEARIPLPLEVLDAPRLGAVVDVAIASGRVVASPTVPSEAVVWNGDEAYVVAVDPPDPVARVVPVVVGATDDVRTAVAGDLADGDTVVVHPPEGTSTGTRLYVVAREPVSP